MGKRLFFCGLLLMAMLVAPSVRLSAQTDSIADAAMREMKWQNNARYFSQGLEKKLNGDFDGAAASFRAALAYNPDDAASMYELSDVLTRTNQPRVNEALSMIETAVQIDSTNKWYWLRLSKFYELNNDIESLISVYERMLRLDPNLIEVMAQLISIYVDRNEYSKALVLLDRFEQLQGISEPVVLQKAELFVQQKKYDEAIAEVKRLTDKYPSETRYLSMLANMYIQVNRDAEALATLEKVKQLNPDDPYVDVALLEYYEKNNDTDKAFDELVSAIRNSNLDLNTKQEIYDYWFKKDLPKNRVNDMARRAAEAFIEAYPEQSMGYGIMGSYYFNEADYEKSAELFSKAITHDSTSYFLWQQLLTVNSMRGIAPDQMLRLSLSAMKFFPTQPIFFWYAGYAYIGMNNIDRAIETFEKGRRFVGDNRMLSTFNMNIGDLYHQKNNRQKAYEAYDRAIAADPDNSLVLNNYAYFLALDSLNLDKAHLMAGHAVELQPANATYLDTYAWVCYVQGDYAAAKKLIEKAIKNDSRQAVYYEHYGDILYKLGKIKKAVLNWKKAKQLGESSQTLNDKISNEKL